MRVGLDIDGVLADFISSYVSLIVRVTGLNLFREGFDWRSWDNWNYEQGTGYTAEEVKAVWAYIVAHPTFWLTLRPYTSTADIANALHAVIRGEDTRHDLYFITHRPDNGSKSPTEQWLMGYGFGMPTVLIAADKGAVAKALKLDVYFDDKIENVADVAHTSPDTQVYLVDRPWNQDLLTMNTKPAPIIRIQDNQIASVITAMLRRNHR